MLVAGIALAPVVGMAQSKGGTVPESPNAPLLKKDGEGKDGDRKQGDRPARLSPEERAKQLAAMFDRLDADANGNLSREEFAKMGARQPRKNGERKGKNGGPVVNKEAEEKKAAEEKKEAEEKAMKKAADEKKEAAEKAAQEAEAKTPEKTRTTGSTGGTGSSASGSQADGSAATGTTAPKP